MRERERERERSVRGFVARRLWVAGEFEGSWVEGFGSKIGSWVRRLVRGFVDRWVEGFGSKIGPWVHRSIRRLVKSKA